jgi:hypothetical protein
MDLSQYADPDLSVLDGATSGKLTQLGHSLDAAADSTRSRISDLASDSGVAVDKAVAELGPVATTTTTYANDAAAIAATSAEAKGAMDKWRSDAPTSAELQAADHAVNQASQDFQAKAQTADAGAALQRLKDAQRGRADLIARREQADADAVAALQRAAMKLPKRAAKLQHHRHDAPWHNPGKSTAPVPRTPAPGAPATHPSAAPGASTGTTPDQAAAIAGLLAGQQRPGQPVQMPQPQAPALTPPPAPTMGGAAKSDRKGLTDDDLAALGVPVTTAVTHPAALANAHSPAPPAPAAPAPATSGTDETGLHTDTNTSGRSDPPRTALSAAGVQNAVGTGGAGATGTAQGTPMGQGMPMVPPMNMGGTGGGGATGKVLKYQSADQAEMNGHVTKNVEVVRGGTIAQRQDGAR